jgi:hypothetical protein
LRLSAVQIVVCIGRAVAAFRQWFWFDFVGIVEANVGPFGLRSVNHQQTS